METKESTKNMLKKIDLKPKLCPSIILKYICSHIKLASSSIKMYPQV